ncbi:MAG TPA: 2-hydroxy-3-oxopropionate reductase, partial [Verrucomicrobiota bacterium]|nr:2-hydroxy-3-oxopropionate reductase [Verrucomicrobiota bacterium]
MMRTVGFIGLGIMGKPMAKNLLKAGFPLVVYDIRPEVVNELVAAGAQAGSSARDVAARSDVVITMLPNSPEVKEAVLGANGVIEGVRADAIVVDMSSIAPATSREVSAQLAARGVRMLDAPVSGGEPKAIDGTLAIMVGGPRDAFDEVKGILEKMGSSVTHVGGIGSGNITKLANQMIVALNIAAVSEALVMATKAGVEPERVYKAIRGGLAGSTVLDAKAPMMLSRNFKPGFRIELHIKDLINATDTARELGAPAPLSAEVLKFFQQLQAQGKGKEDHGGLVQYYESL